MKAEKIGQQDLQMVDTCRLWVETQWKKRLGCYLLSLLNVNHKKMLISHPTVKCYPCKLLALKKCEGKFSQNQTCRPK